MKLWFWEMVSDFAFWLDNFSWRRICKIKGIPKEYPKTDWFELDQ